MKFNRNPHLINKAMTNYLIASIMSMLMTQLNVTIDGIIVSHLVGSNALSAINLYMPLNLAVQAFLSLFGIGATIAAAKALGERNHQRVSKLLSTAVLSVIVVGFILAGAAWTFKELLTSMMCQQPVLRPYFEDYAFIMLTCCVVTLISLLFSTMVSIDGHPRTATKVVMIQTVTNIVLDLLLVGVFGLGIAGSAIATIAATAFGVVLFSFYIFGSKCSYKIRPVSLFSMNSLKENIQQGLPLILSNMTLMLLMLFINTFVQRKEGISGIFAVSVCINLLSYGTLFAGGIGSTALSVGGFLLGQNDLGGVRILVHRCLKFVVGSLTIVSLVILIYPQLLSSLFNAETPTLAAYTNRALRIFALSLPLLMLTITMANIYQMLGRLILTPIVALLFPVVTVPALILADRFLGSTNLWYAFPLTGILLVVTTFLITEGVRMHEKGLQLFTLVPKVEDNAHTMFFLSINTEDCDVAAVDVEIGHRMALLDVSQQVAADCRDSLTTLIGKSIAEAAHDSKCHVIDVHVQRKDSELWASVKDDGNQRSTIPLEPCPQAEYKYNFGENMTFMKF